MLFDKSADIGYQWLRYRDLGIAPTELPVICGSDAYVAIFEAIAAQKTASLIGRRDNSTRAFVCRPTAPNLGLFHLQFQPCAAKKDAIAMPAHQLRGLAR